MMSKIRLASDGSQLGVIEAGSGAPVVLFHGVGMCAASWEPQIAALSRSCRVIAIDLPGHGYTDRLGGAPTLRDYVAWAAMAIRSLGLGPVSLAGHSMGALVAMGVGVEHPDLVSHLALLNAVYRRDAAARDAVLGRARELAHGAADPEAPLARWFREGELPGVRAQVGQWLREVDPQGYAETYTAFANGDAVYAGLLHRITCPTLVLTGEEDHNSSPAMTRAIAAAIPQARAVVIDGARHMTSLTEPDAVTRELALWLGLEKEIA